MQLNTYSAVKMTSTVLADQLKQFSRFGETRLSLAQDKITDHFLTAINGRPCQGSAPLAAGLFQSGLTDLVLAPNLSRSQTRKLKNLFAAAQDNKPDELRRLVKESGFIARINQPRPNDFIETRFEPVPIEPTDKNKGDGTAVTIDQEKDNKDSLAFLPDDYRRVTGAKFAGRIRRIWQTSVGLPELKDKTGRSDIFAKFLSSLTTDIFWELRGENPYMTDPCYNASVTAAKLLEKIGIPSVLAQTPLFSNSIHHWFIISSIDGVEYYLDFTASDFGARPPVILPKDLVLNNQEMFPMYQFKDIIKPSEADYPYSYNYFNNPDHPINLFLTGAFPPSREHKIRKIHDQNNPFKIGYVKSWLGLRPAIMFRQLPLAWGPNITLDRLIRRIRNKIQKNREKIDQFCCDRGWLKFNKEKAQTIILWEKVGQLVEQIQCFTKTFSSIETRIASTGETGGSPKTGSDEIRQSAIDIDRGIKEYIAKFPRQRLRSGMRLNLIVGGLLNKLLTMPSDELKYRLAATESRLALIQELVKAYNNREAFDEDETYLESPLDRLGAISEWDLELYDLE